MHPIELPLLDSRRIPFHHFNRWTPQADDAAFTHPHP